MHAVCLETRKGSCLSCNYLEDSIPGLPRQKSQISSKNSHPLPGSPGSHPPKRIIMFFRMALAGYMRTRGMVAGSKSFQCSVFVLLISSSQVWSVQGDPAAPVSRPPNKIRVGTVVEAGIVEVYHNCSRSAQSPYIFPAEHVAKLKINLSSSQYTVLYSFCAHYSILLLLLLLFHVTIETHESRDNNKKG